MYKIVKKYKAILIVFLLIVLVSSIYFKIAKQTSSRFNDVTIVLDAGHGGRDGGCVGVSGSVEKELNLKYVLSLKEKLVKYGYKVVLTRATDDGLYSPIASNKKISDMNARMEIIKKNNPNLVISIHMNSFNDSSVSGANCFYKIDDEASFNCANLIQKSLYTNCDVLGENAKKGDYFMLNCSYYTSVLIECGFLSNPEEEIKLNSEEYLNKFTDAIANALLLYFGKG